MHFVRCHDLDCSAATMFRTIVEKDVATAAGDSHEGDAARVLVEELVVVFVKAAVGGDAGARPRRGGAKGRSFEWCSIMVKRITLFGRSG